MCGGGSEWGRVGSHGTRSNEVPESDNVFEQSKRVGIYIRGVEFLLSQLTPLHRYVEFEYICTYYEFIMYTILL